MDVPRVGSEHLAPGTILRCKGNQGIEHVVGPGLAEQLAGTPRDRPIGQDQLGSGQHPGQAGLALSCSPRLGDHRGRHHGSLPGAMGFGEERPSIAITPVESDERPCIEHPHAAGGLRRRVGGCQAVRTLAAAMSSSVIGPESASYSAMAVAKRSRPTRSAAAWAIQELTPPRPARTRTSARRSPGRVTVNLGISRFTLWSMTQVLPEMRGRGLEGPGQLGEGDADADSRRGGHP